MSTQKLGNLYWPIGSLESSTISIEDGKIARISTEDDPDSINCARGQILPGFVDIHNHGAVGVDVNNATCDELIRVAAFLARNGVTTWLPTLVPDSQDSYRFAIDAIGQLIERQVSLPIAQAAGVHYEGVFANQQMCGALRPEYFRSGSRSAVGGHLPKLDRGVHMTTLAPEIDGGIELIEALVADGWVVSIGHTRASAETLDRAYSAGARHMTHFFNAMTGIHHRDIGVAGWGLATQGVTFDIIADGIHVDPRMVEMACRAKSPDKVTLISDSVAPTGLGDGEFELWGETISVVSGRTRNERGSIAGSVCTMHDCVKTVRGLGFSAAEIAKMASINPSHLLGLEDRGSIEVGKRADIVAIDQDGGIAFTMIGGQMVPK